MRERWGEGGREMCYLAVLTNSSHLYTHTHTHTHTHTKISCSEKIRARLVLAYTSVCLTLLHIDKFTYWYAFEYYI